MARRKRLTLSPEGTLPDGAVTGAPDALPPLETKAMSFAAPPIARVAAETSAAAALDEMSQAWAEARDSGRLIQRLPLESIDAGWLARDRMRLDEYEMDELVDSIAARGQQMPIEVVALEEGRFGLISGWRRLTALKILCDAGEAARFDHVLAVLRRPAGKAEAYRSMVEENELRAGLSYYERARIAARAAAAGAFADARAAIDALFASGSRARRSKIRSFLSLVEQIGDRLRFGWAIPERLGLELARALEADPVLTGRLRERLRKSAPDTPEAELALLARALQGSGPEVSDADALPPEVLIPEAPPSEPPGPGTAAGPAPRTTGSGGARPSREEIAPGLWLKAQGRPEGLRLTLEGASVDDGLHDRLRNWLRQAAGSG